MALDEEIEENDGDEDDGEEEEDDDDETDVVEGIVELAFVALQALSVPKRKEVLDGISRPVLVAMLESDDPDTDWEEDDDGEAYEKTDLVDFMLDALKDC